MTVGLYLLCLGVFLIEHYLSELFTYLHALVYRLLCCWLPVLTNAHIYIHAHHYQCPLVFTEVTWGTVAWVLDSRVTRLSSGFIVKCVTVHRVPRANRGHRCSLSEKVFVCQYKMAVYCHNGLIECEIEQAPSLYMTERCDKTLPITSLAETITKVLLLLSAYLPDLD